MSARTTWLPAASIPPTLTVTIGASSIGPIRTSHGYFHPEHSLGGAARASGFLEVPGEGHPRMPCLLSKQEKALPERYFLVNGLVDPVFPILAGVVECPAFPRLVNSTYWLWRSPYSGRCLVHTDYWPTDRMPEEPGFEGFRIVKRRLHTYVGVWPRPNENSKLNYAIFWQLGV